MITLEKNYAIYTGYISSPTVEGMVCAVCGKSVGRPSGRIEARGWVCYHVNKHVLERYCPECATRVWPLAYPEKMKSAGE